MVCWLAYTHDQKLEFRLLSSKESGFRGCRPWRSSLRETCSRRVCKGRSRLLWHLLFRAMTSSQIFVHDHSKTRVNQVNSCSRAHTSIFRSRVSKGPAVVLLKLSQESVPRNLPAVSCVLQSSRPGYCSHLLRSCFSFALVPVVGAVVK